MVASGLSNELRVEVANLHDAYMNADVAWVAMHRCPVVATDDPARFMTSDRGRFERLWWALVAVYLESWRSARMRKMREFVCGASDTSQLQSLIRRTTQEPVKQLLYDARGYMFHRDRRAYWDAGRFAPINELHFLSELHVAFGKAMLAAMGGGAATADSAQQQPGSESG
jgi:hypothetical protein